MRRTMNNMVREGAIARSPEGASLVGPTLGACIWKVNIRVN